MYSRIMPERATPGLMMELAATRVMKLSQRNFLSRPRMAGLSM